MATVEERLTEREAIAAVQCQVILENRKLIEELQEAVAALTPTDPTPDPAPDPEPDPEPSPVSGSFLRPFSDASPWNIPAPAAGSTTDPRTVQIRANLNPGGATGINVTNYSLPNYQAADTDPLVDVVDVGHGNLTYKLRIPAGAVPAAGTDSNMAILQPDGWLYDMWIARWVGSARIETQRIGRTRIDGTGCGPAVKVPTGQWVPAGIRAAGCSWLGGMIRRHEIEAGVIPHALALALPGKWLRYDSSYYGSNSGEHIIGERGETPESMGADAALLGTGNYRGFVPPATEQDHGSAWGDYSRGSGIPMGTRFVIPASVNLDSLGLNPHVRMMAKAAQDYGVIVVDKTSVDPLWAMFYAEPAAADTEFGQGWWSDDSITRLRRALVVV